MDHKFKEIELLNYKLWLVTQQIQRKHAQTIEKEQELTAEQSSLELELYELLAKKYGGGICSSSQ